MVGKEYLNKFQPKSKFIRQQVGYIALLLGAIVAKISVRGKWHLPSKGGYIVSSNHFSIIDPPFFKYAIQKPINFLAASVTKKLAKLFYGLFTSMDSFQLIEKTLHRQQLKKQKKY